MIFDQFYKVNLRDLQKTTFRYAVITEKRGI